MECTHRPLASQDMPEATASPITRWPAAFAFTTCDMAVMQRHQKQAAEGRANKNLA